MALRFPALLAWPMSRCLLLVLAGTGPLAARDFEEGNADPSVVAWPTGPLDVRVALATPLDASAAKAMVGRLITYAVATPGQTANPSGSASPMSLKIAATRFADDGRTLLLATDPHPVQARYSVSHPVGLGGPTIQYDLSGAEAAWTEGDEEGAEASWKVWWPTPDLESARRLAPISVQHRQFLGVLDRIGRLTVTALVKLPDGEQVVRIESNRKILEASLGDAVAEVDKPSTDAVELSVRSGGEPQFLTLTVSTGKGEAAQTLRVVRAPSAKGPFQPIGRESLLLPWAPLPGPSAPESVPAILPNLTGGDPKRGEALFNGDQGRCAQCHMFRGKGTTIGPELSEAVRKGCEYLYRSIAAPSAQIAPAYLPYTVAARDGRVLAGLVRAEGADEIRVTDNAAKSTLLRRDEIEELRPSGTSIMPVGLAGVLGEAGLRDLFAYLLGSPAE